VAPARLREFSFPAANRRLVAMLSDLTLDEIAERLQAGR
jgi:hypothetical protein